MYVSTHQTDKQQAKHQGMFGDIHEKVRKHVREIHKQIGVIIKEKLLCEDFTTNRNC